jgi:hypothetical protein
MSCADSTDSWEDEDGSSPCEGCDGSGIRCPAGPSCVIPDLDESVWTIVERCDNCELYENDFEAARVLFEVVQWVQCTEGGDHVIAQLRRQPEPSLDHEAVTS